MKTVPIYETDSSYNHKRTPQNLICRGRLIKTNVLLNAELGERKVSPQNGLFCTVKVTTIKKKDRGLVKGEVYKFNVADKDLNTK